MTASIHAFTVLACAVVAASAAASIAIAGVKGRALAVFGCVVAVAATVLLLESRGITCTNDLSSYNLARAVAETRSFQLDPWVKPGSIDISRYANHYYSDRPPLTGWLAAIPYAMVRVANLGAPFPPDVENAVLLVPILATLVAMVAVLRLCTALGSSEDAALLAVTVFALGSPALVYGRVLFVHAVSAALVVGGCYYLVRSTGSRRRLFTAGFLLGLSVIADYSNAILIATGGVWLLVRRPDGVPRVATAVAFAAGVVGPACALMAYNYACFGNPLTLSYAYCKFAWARTFGGTFSGPFLDGFLGLTVRWPTGIFIWSPIALLGIPGLVMKARRDERGRRLLLLAMFIVILLSMAKHKTWYGGGTVDARYLSSVFALLLPGVALIADRILRAGGWVPRALLAVGVAGCVVLRWVWATRFVDYVGFVQGPVVTALGLPIVPALMVGAVLVWFLAVRPRSMPQGAAVGAGLA